MSIMGHEKGKVKYETQNVLSRCGRPEVRPLSKQKGDVKTG